MVCFSLSPLPRVFQNLLFFNELPFGFPVGNAFFIIFITFGALAGHSYTLSQKFTQ